MPAAAVLAVPPPAPEAERLARAGLSRVAEPDDHDVQRLLHAHGAVAVWSALVAGADGLPPALAVRTAGRAAAVRPERDLERAAAAGGRLLCPGDDEWPAGTEELALPPFALWVRGGGSLREVAARSVAIVGSRAATSYGTYVAGELASGLGDRGWSTVSGGAYGIDGAAHRGSIAVGAPTVATLACGIDVSYPTGHETLFARIAEIGVLVSEWPPGCSPMRHRFLCRNRLIAAITRGTVVVEAAARSGARRTATDALTLGRPVMVVPGPVTSPMSVGCHVLLRDGATCVTTAAEVVEEIGAMGDDLAPRAEGRADVRDGLGPVAYRVLDATPKQRPAPVARIAATSGLGNTEVAHTLAGLESAGLVESRHGHYRLTTAASAARKVPP